MLDDNQLLGIIIYYMDKPPQIRSYLNNDVRRYFLGKKRPNFYEDLNRYGENPENFKLKLFSLIKYLENEGSNAAIGSFVVFSYLGTNIDNAKKTIEKICTIRKNSYPKWSDFKLFKLENI